MSVRLETVQRLVNRPETWDFEGCGRVYIGVDIGTYSVVAILVDESGRPRAANLRHAEVVKSGLIVDYMGALTIVKELVDELKARCPLPVEYGATTYPPDTERGNIKATTHILNSAGIEVIETLDEPSAANHVLNLDHGAIVDIGGGTTGIAVIEGGKVVYSGDEATGGIHLTLVLAGALGIPTEEAELIKADKSQAGKVMGIVMPVVDKISTIIERHLKAWPKVEKICMVGGTCELEGLTEAVGANTGKNAVRPFFPQAVTPLGVALSCLDAVGKIPQPAFAGGRTR